MCMMIYISAARPLDFVSLDKANPTFHVSPLSEKHKVVGQQFHYSNVYSVGAYDGCGCGFQYGQYPEYEDDERELKRASLDAFSDYLVQQLNQVKVIELFACWDGDQSKTPEHNRRFTPKTFQSKDFYFYEKEFSEIYKDVVGQP
jgi:hypothetical protein